MDLLILYITVGIALQGLVRPHVRFASRVITLLAWPVLLFLEGLSICNHALHHALVTTITMLIDTVCCGQLRSDDTRDLFNKYLSTLPDDIRSRYDELQTISARGTPH
jgi:hypothetical protein